MGDEKKKKLYITFEVTEELRTRLEDVCYKRKRAKKDKFTQKDMINFLLDSGLKKFEKEN